MSRTPQEILKMAADYTNLATETLLVTAKKKEKKLDPKAKVRNRGTVCVPAEKAKDKKDHFPINDADQARNALARVHQYSSKPEWWGGSLKGLQDLVARKVKAKYPKIDVGGKEKKSYVEVNDSILSKYGQGQGTWNPTEQTEEDAAKFMATPTQFQGGAQAKPQAQARATSPELQKAQSVLAQTPKYKAMLGTTGPNRDGVDGQMGQHTQAALKAWREDMGFPQATDAMTIYLLNNPDARPQVAQKTVYDAKATTDALHTVQGYLADYAEQSKTKKVDAAEARTYMQGALDWATKTLQAIADKLKDPKITDQEKQQVQAMDARVRKAHTDIGVWMKYLDTLPKATTARVNLNRLLAKYGQQPMDPDWLKSQQPAAPAQQAAPQQAAPQAQQAAPQQAAPQAQQTAPQQAAPRAQQTAPQAQPQQQAKSQLSAQQVKEISNWISEQLTATNHQIQRWGGVLGIGSREGIAALKDAEKYPEEVLEQMQDDYQENLKYIEKIRPFADQFSNETSQYLHKLESNSNIILRRINTEIANRRDDEARERRRSRRRF